MRIFFFLPVFLIFSSISHSQTKLAGKDFPEQVRLLDSLSIPNTKGEGVSISKALLPYIEQAIEYEDSKLEALLKARYLFDMYKTEELSDEQYTIEYEALIAKCKKKKWNDILAFTYLEHSAYLKKVGRIVDWGKYQLMAYDLYSQFDTSYFTKASMYTKKLGEYYYRFGDYANSRKFIRESERLSHKFDPSLYNTLGLTHYIENNNDSALFYFDSAYRYCVINKRKRWQILLSGNMIEAYIRTNRYDKAISIGDDIIGLTDKSDIVHCKMQNAVGYVYLLKKDAVTADKYYKKAYNCFAEIDPDWTKNYLSDASVLLDEYGQVKNILGDYKTAYVYADLASKLKDTLHDIINLQELKKVENELSQAKLASTQKTLTYEKNRTKLQRNLLVATVVAVTFVLLFVIYRYRSRRDKLEYERDKAATELESSKEKLSGFKKSIQEKNKLLESFEERLSKYEPDEDALEYTKSITELKESTILTDEEWDDFKNTFEKVYVGFLSRLKEQHPELTPAETRYVVLSKLDMSTKEMAAILGVNSSSIRTLKSRLIKKVGINNEQELTDIVNSI